MLLLEVILCQHKFNTFNISLTVKLYFLYFAYKIYREGKLYSYDSSDSITGFETLPIGFRTFSFLKDYTKCCI